jgi:hypothetical protein
MHHYLAQAYLRGFTDHGHRDKKGNLRVIDLLEKRCFTSPTKGVASIRDYYVFQNTDERWPSREFDRWISAFEKGYPRAQRIVFGIGRSILRTDGDHVGTSLYPFLQHYPTRFLDGLAPEFEGVVRGKIPIVALNVTPEMIQASDTGSVVTALRYMIGTRENALRFKLKVELLVTGYDDDPRGLWQIPDVRESSVRSSVNALSSCFSPIRKEVSSRCCCVAGSTSRTSQTKFIPSESASSLTSPSRVLMT